MPINEPRQPVNYPRGGLFDEIRKQRFARSGLPRDYPVPEATPWADFGSNVMGGIQEFIAPEADVDAFAQMQAEERELVKQPMAEQAAGMLSPEKFGLIAPYMFGAGVIKGARPINAPKPSVAELRAEANASRFGDDVDYRGHHTAPGREGLNTLDDLTDIFPDDVYNPSVAGRYYGHGGDAAGIAMDNQTARIVSKFRGNPDAEIEIFRAVPKGVDKISAGDWVTVNKDYAKMHGESWVADGQFDVVSMRVKAKDLTTDGNSIHEWGYSP